MKEVGFAWWIDRLGASGERYDVIRLDHFRGFETYWSVPYGDKTAKNGKWMEGPGMDFINALKKNLPEVSFIAEDLGVLTEKVVKLRNDSGYPGMKVLGFAFDSRDPSDYLTHCYPHNTVCYTGTHDNMTTKQWFENASADSVDYATEYMSLTERDGQVIGTIRAGMRSVSDLFVAPMQDWLELGRESRMNFPGTMSDANWTWRAEEGFDSPELAANIFAMTKMYGRLASSNQ